MRDSKSTINEPRCFGREQMRRSGVRTSTDRRTGSGRLRRTRNGRRSSRGRHEEPTSSSMVRSIFTSFLTLLIGLFLGSFADDAHAARWKYKKDVDKLKPDLEAYNIQKETAMGLAPGTLSQNSFSFSLTRCDPTQASGSSGSQVEQLLTL